MSLIIKNKRLPLLFSGGSSNILFKDIFAGTVIDTSKWTVINPNPDRITFEQDDELQIVYQDTVNGGSNLDGMIGVDAFDNIVAVSYDVEVDDSPNNDFNVGITSDNDLTTNENRIMIYRDTLNTKLNILIKIGNVAELVDDFVIDATLKWTVKILLSATNIKFLVWETGSWVEKGTWATVNFTGNWKAIVMARSLSGNTIGEMSHINNFSLSSVDFDTQYP